MTIDFNLVKAVTDWQQHDDEDKRQQRLTQLRIGEAQAKQRDLERAAERFRPSPDLLNAMNAALITRTPLLLTGEPGTGKTQVAYFLARYFQIKLFKYQVHSNSQAKDMRYDFDAVAYLRDAYLAQHTNNPALLEDERYRDEPRNNPKYLKKGELWAAYQCEEPSVLLIDEIDKAPRDFPNDLLLELDQNRFPEPFVQGKEVVNEGAPPIVILTSNGERRLPDAFLRRCMVHQITLDDALLKSVLSSWQGQLHRMQSEQEQEALQQAALQVFNKIRRLPLSKKPGTAELLLWISVLSAQGVTADTLEHPVKKPIPALSALIKEDGDFDQVTDHFQQES